MSEARHRSILGTLADQNDVTLSAPTSQTPASTPLSVPSAAVTITGPLVETLTTASSILPVLRAANVNADFCCV